MSRAPVVLGLMAAIPAIAFAAQQSRYDVEYPTIGYERGVPADSIARLQQQVAAGDTQLRYTGESGYLTSLLEALDIDVSSQTLVFSKTSLQVATIAPDTPRAIYFNDDTYVAYVQGGVIEVVTVDPNLGLGFYTLRQDASSPAALQRETIRCLECHDAFSLTGGGVPRLLVGSGLVGPTGDLASHEGRFLTDDRTPLNRRWGGWYVTGTHGEQNHRGNLIILDAEHARTLDLADTGNVTNLRRLLNPDAYPGEHSDIVALLVLEHQTHVQNAIIRASWETRRLLANERPRNVAAGRGEDEWSATTLEAVAEFAEPLVAALLMAEQPALTSPITGTSGFREHFEALGPADEGGRSLRQLDLQHRIFRYPLSYVVYSEAFDALPDVLRTRVYERLQEILAGHDTSPPFTHLSAESRVAMYEILEATKPEFGGMQ